MEPEAFVQEVAEILLPWGGRTGEWLLARPLARPPAPGEPRIRLCKRKGWKKQTLKQPQANSDTPHIIDLCMHPVTHSHDGQGGVAPPFIPILSPSSAGASGRSREDVCFSLVQKDMGLKSHKAPHGVAGWWICQSFPAARQGRLV